MCGCMSAARRSTTRPISATHGRSPSSTCSTACCATNTARTMSPMCATSPMSRTRSWPRRRRAARRSARSEHTLGETFDIHGGGLDLIFPHHENEIAQSVCGHDGRPFANYWLHNGMLTVGGAKMAKSEGNFITVRDARAQAPGEVIRLALLSTHYRDPLDWTPDRLHQARQTLDRFYRALALPGARQIANDVDTQVRGALDADLNLPLALTHLHELAGMINRTGA